MAQSDTHERVQQNKNASLVHNRAKLVLEIEAFIECKPSDDTQSPWLHSLLNAARVLLTLPLPCNRMPTVLYVLQPKASGDDDGQNSEWQGRMRVMFRKFDRLDGNQKGLESKITDNNKQLQEALERQHLTGTLPNLIEEPPVPDFYGTMMQQDEDEVGAMQLQGERFSESNMDDICGLLQEDDLAVVVGGDPLSVATPYDMYV